MTQTHLQNYEWKESLEDLNAREEARAVASYTLLWGITQSSSEGLHSPAQKRLLVLRQFAVRGLVNVE